MATNAEPHKCIIFVKSTKICTHEIKAIHSNLKMCSNTFISCKCIYVRRPQGRKALRLSGYLLKIKNLLNYLVNSLINNFAKFSPGKNNHVYSICLFNNYCAYIHIIVTVDFPNPWCFNSRICKEIFFFNL